MELRDYAVLMAEYNEWMNTRLYEAAARLPPQALMADRGAFFGSVYGTLNHLVAADTIWLKRFAADPAAHRASVLALAPVGALPQPASLDALQAGDLEALRLRRTMLDGVIRRWAASLSAPDVDAVLHYTNSRGPSSKRFAGVVMHFFNHQTHHRGQASTLLSQAGIDIGVTDLLLLIPDVA